MGAGANAVARYRACCSRGIDYNMFKPRLSTLKAAPLRAAKPAFSLVEKSYSDSQIRVVDALGDVSTRCSSAGSALFNTIPRSRSRTSGAKRRALLRSS